MPRTADLTLDDFALIVRLAELRNLSALAREREVPASQVSRALARIEARCGVPLVHRSTHGLSMTDEGETFAEHAARLLAQARELDAELDERRGAVSGRVRVALSSAMALLVLPSLPALLERHPGLRLDLAADDRLVDLARDGIDIAIRTGTPFGDDLVARPLGRFVRALYAAPQYLERHGAPRGPDDLAAHALIGNSAMPALNRWRFRGDGGAREVTVDGRLRVDDSGLALALVLAGLGIGRISAQVAAPHVEAGRLVPVLAGQLEPTGIPIYAALLPQRQRAPKLRACIDHWVAWFAAREDFA